MTLDVGVLLLRRRWGACAQEWQTHHTHKTTPQDATYTYTCTMMAVSHAVMASCAATPFSPSHNWEMVPPCMLASSCGGQPPSAKLSHPITFLACHSHIPPTTQCVGPPLYQVASVGTSDSIHWSEQQCCRGNKHFWECLTH